MEAAAGPLRPLLLLAPVIQLRTIKLCYLLEVNKCSVFKKRGASMKFTATGWSRDCGTTAIANIDIDKARTELASADWRFFKNDPVLSIEEEPAFISMHKCALAANIKCD